MSSVVLNPSTLPSNDNLPDNAYAFCIDLTEPWFMSKGAMIAYYGQMTFEALAATSVAGMVAQRFSSPLYVRDWVVATGQGRLVIGDRGFDINSFDLDDGNLTIRASNLLAFQTGLSLTQSIVPGFLTLVGTGKFLASSSGPVMFAEPPVRVDPEALVGWADCPSPSHHFDAGWMQGYLGAARGMVLGHVSGEERQFDFTGAGTVLIQSSESLAADAHLLQHIEGQLSGLSQAQLQALGRTIAQRTQQQ